MITSIEKEKLPCDFSYIIKTKQIEDILMDSLIETNVDIRYGQFHVNNVIFSADYYFPSDSGWLNGIYICVDAVAKDQICIAQEQMKDIILPEFIKWIKAIEQLDNTSVLYYKKHFFEADLQGNKVFINKGYR